MNTLDKNLIDNPIVHLTMVGSQAGRPYCGCNKQVELIRNARFVHYMHAPKDLFTHPKLCQACKVIMDEVEAECKAEDEVESKRNSTVWESRERGERA